jgi:pimeloyl-ACP methyl ester carboxylesterase
MNARVKVVERHADLAGLEVWWREAKEGDGGAPPILYLHGVPNSSEMYGPFLERTGGIAPDLPGFGKSGKPAEFDYSIRGYDRFLEAFTAAAGLERLSLVVHDWGAVGLAFAQRFPERVDRLVAMASVPLLPGYRWHRIARIWRTPLLGELFMGSSTRWALKRLSGLPDEVVDQIWRHFDHGTQRAILKLYRSAPEAVLARAGARLGAVRGPALVVWPTADPYIDAAFGPAYADALGGEVRLDMVERAGHWPWLERPETIGKVADFLQAG